MKYYLKTLDGKRIEKSYSSIKEMREDLFKIIEENGTQGIFDFVAEYSFGVCKGRHEMPVENYVYDEIIDPTDVKDLDGDAYLFMLNHENEIKEAEVIRIYVTGLTVALIAILNNLFYRYKEELRERKVYLMHYSTKTGTYFEQEIGGIE